MRYLITIITAFLLLLSSCKHTQFISANKETIRIDTFFRYREFIKTLPQKDSIIIFNPCDSSGILSRFYTQISIPNGKVEIQSKNNHIVASVVATGITSSIIDSTKLKETSRSTSAVEKVIVKNIIPSWIIITLFIESMIILLYLYFKLIYLK
jgi:hypothetical protein